MFKKKLLISLIFLLWASSVWGQTPPVLCPSAFPNIASDICWGCLFPLRIGGRTVMSGDSPDNVGTANPDDFNPSSYTCMCEKNDGGNIIPRFGVYVSFWEPAKVIEVVQYPGCYPFLFGMNADEISFFGAMGTAGQRGKSSEKAFYNVHFYLMPLLAITEILVGGDYCTDMFTGIDLGYSSEWNPLWADDVRAIWLNPQAAMFGIMANPLAQALCPIDCAASSAGFPLNWMFWCAGCWGSMYPLTGNTGGVGSPVRTTSLLAARLLAQGAQLPIPPLIELDTSGPGAKCGGVPSIILKKSQYKMSTLFPIPETKGNCCHSLGASTFTWGEFRNIPGIGEFQIYMLWRKRNCCFVFF